MSFLDALNHLLNLFGPALGVGLLASALAKLLWRRRLAAVPWRRLALWACAAGALATLSGLVLLGRDGRMASYVALVGACAAALWWAGFVRRR
jgi:threonine/homoserine efflux transporter RhtA